MQLFIVVSTYTVTDRSEFYRLLMYSFRTKNSVAIYNGSIDFHLAFENHEQARQWRNPQSAVHFGYHRFDFRWGLVILMLSPPQSLLKYLQITYMKFPE
jgi:hypothetical protein